MLEIMPRLSSPVIAKAFVKTVYFSFFGNDFTQVSINLE